MRTNLFDTVKFPCWALAAVINSDFSGLSAEEEILIDDFLKSLPENHIIGIPKEDQPDPYFTRKPAFGLACNVYDIDIIEIID
jgi:hypothetical protein